MPKPAEGSWRVSWSRESQSWLILNEDERMIATAFESETNARRIAAVPVMEKALESSDQADQDGWATGTPRKEAGVSACRGAGNQGNAHRDTRTDQPASAGTWLACFESTGISDSYGVVRGK